jgi:hypothetical protein
MLAEKLLARLEKVKTSPGKHPQNWKACCPSHKDNDPSLEIAETAGGKLLVNCWAGCSPLDVITAVGLDWSDMFAEDKPERSTRPRSELDVTIDAYLRTFKSATTDEAVRLFCKAERAAAKKAGRKPSLTANDLQRERQAFNRMRATG